MRAIFEREAEFNFCRECHILKAIPLGTGI